MGRGKFITFEGGDGAGKSTQAHYLNRRLRKCKIEADLTREPGGTPMAEALRAVLLDSGLARRSPLCELLTFYAARADHLASRIRPALDRGMWVICDRFSDSTRAYQGALERDVDEACAKLDALVVGDNRPDLTIVLDVEPEEGMRRALARSYGHSSVSKAEPKQMAFNFASDRFEALDLRFHQRVRQIYLEIAASEPERCVVISSTGGIKEIEERVWSAVSERFSNLLSEK